MLTIVLRTPSGRSVFEILVKQLYFNLPHMEYEGLVSCREKFKKIIADFYVLGLFMAKKHDLSEKIFSVCHAPGRLPLNAKFVPRLQPRP
jgi:hypothetical protein